MTVWARSLAFNTRREPSFAVATRNHASTRNHALSPSTPRRLQSSGKMASPYPDYSFGPDYSKGPFPAIPRRAGVAKVTVSTEPAAPSAFPTTAQLVSKEALAAAFPGLEGSDAATDGSAARYEGERRVLFHSFGPAAKADLAAVKRAAVAAVSRARALKVAGGLELVAPAVAGVPAAKVAEGVAQAAALANYAFDRYITAADKLPALLPALHVRLPAGGPDAAAAVAAGELAAALAEATVFARDLSNERADEMNPARLEAEARAVAAEIGASVTVVTGAELLEKGLHLMAAVGQAARHAPRYVELAIAGDPAHPDDVILLVGKGITYDTGGLNIKGTGFMEDMHMDMSG